MARQYNRDARGRFASGGSSGRRAGGTLAARASLRSSRKKLAAKDSADGSLKGTLSKRAQKAAVTKGSNRLKEAKKAATVRIAGRRGGTISRPKGYVRPGAAKQQTQAIPAASGSRKTYRTRAQAAAAYRERIRRTKEFAMSAPGMSSEWQGGPQSITRTRIRVDQGNLLTGRTEKVTTNVRTKQSHQSRIGQSAASRKTQQRRDRAEARYEALIAERKSITAKGRVKAGALARNSQRMSAVSGAFRVYDMGTGRKPSKKRTGRRR